MAEATQAPEKSWGEMNAQERDAWLAENVMGWDVDRRGEVWQATVLAPDDSVLRHLHIGGVRTRWTWSPSGDLGDAYEVQERLREFPDAYSKPGLALAYADHLVLVVRGQENVPYAQRRPFDTRETIFLCAHATAEQRAHAAYLTIMTARKEGWIET